MCDLLRPIPVPPPILVWHGTVGKPVWHVGEQYHEKIPHQGIVAGEITAFRCWFWRRDALQSIFYDCPWLPGESVAGDVRSAAGIHAWKTLKLARQYADWAALTLYPVVFGRVALWGEVAEHHNGYRAEFAKVTAIHGARYRYLTAEGARDQRDRRLLMEIRARYGL